MASLNVCTDIDNPDVIDIWVIPATVETEDGPEDDISVVHSKKTRQFVVTMDRKIAEELSLNLRLALGEGK